MQHTHCIKRALARGIDCCTDSRSTGRLATLWVDSVIFNLSQAAGLIAWATQDWRQHLLLANTISLPASLASLFIFQESPRWLIQKGRYAQAATCLNRIAWFNRRPVRFTAADLCHVKVLHEHKDKHYTIWHLFATRRLALYSVTQALTGCVQSLVWMVILMGIGDLAGSPFMTIVLLGVLRLWTPFTVIALDTRFRWFGRRLLLLTSLGLVSLCFGLMVAIHVAGYWEQLHGVASALGLFGYAVNFGLVWNAYKQYSAELYPTEMRSIALSSFSLLTTAIASPIGPQLVYLKKYWFPMPYCGTHSKCVFILQAPRCCRQPPGCSPTSCCPRRAASRCGTPMRK